jgi:hypothetical protein
MLRSNSGPPNLWAYCPPERALLLRAQRLRTAGRRLANRGVEERRSRDSGPAAALAAAQESRLTGLTSAPRAAAATSTSVSSPDSTARTARPTRRGRRPRGLSASAAIGSVASRRAPGDATRLEPRGVAEEPHRGAARADLDERDGPAARSSSRPRTPGHVSSSRPHTYFADGGQDRGLGLPDELPTAGGPPSAIGPRCGRPRRPFGRTWPRRGSRRGAAALRGAPPRPTRRSRSVGRSA